MFNILHLFVDHQTGSLYNLDKTIIVNEGPDIAKILNYNIIIVISETSSAIYTNGQHFPDYTVYFDKINVIEELLQNYYCKYDRHTRIFTKENINIYSLVDYSFKLNLKKHKTIYKFNDYNEYQNTNESFLHFLNAIQHTNKKTHLMSEMKYHETTYTFSEFINLISDDNNILINSYHDMTANLRCEIEFFRSEIHKAEKEMIKIDNVVIDNVNKNIEILMKQEKKKIQDHPNFNDIPLEFKLLDIDLKTELVGFKIADNGKLNYSICNPEAYLGFVPKYYNVRKY
ncbi:hypothetical protein Hokovirus_1_330 [Hokovirus HKV1]|uniref:Uncharacterized protein n=1 Tax=Hokovirus HKV1 TaxID=1977638 RepID=A0A1V0SFJ3_9VIRU|nr:hypothetical protein Hokovirus_1_330 [Hokovirus HKV1]